MAIAGARDRARRTAPEAPVLAAGRGYDRNITSTEALRAAMTTFMRPGAPGLVARAEDWNVQRTLVPGLRPVRLEMDQGVLAAGTGIRGCGFRTPWSTSGRATPAAMETSCFREGIDPVTKCCANVHTGQGCSPAQTISALISSISICC